MPNIDTRLDFRPAQASRPQDQAFGQPHKQAWLRALEATGLKSATDGTRVFKLASATGASVESATAEGLRADLPTLAKPQDPMLAGKATTAPPPTGVAHRSTGAWVTVPASGASPTDAPAGVLAEARLELDSPAPAAEELQPNGRRAVLADLVRWDTQRLSILRNPAGEMEVWIRDATLEMPKALAILDNLRKSMGELGASLVRGSLNGKQVFARGDGEARNKTIQGD